MNKLLNGLTVRDLEVLEALFKYGPRTKNDLMEKLNLKLTTLNRSMGVLLDKRLIVESGICESTGGRKPSQYDVRQEGIYTFGVDISRTYVKVLLMNLKQSVLYETGFDIDSRTTPQKCIDHISDEISRTLAHLGILSESALGIGVGTVGPLNREKGSMLYPQGFQNPEWKEEIPLRDMLQNATNIPCTIDNGANTALLAEYLFGSGQGHRCVAYIHCGVGIRSAVIRDGTIIRTMNDSEDAFTHMTVDLCGRLCHCGGRGCLENYVSLEAMRSEIYSKTGENISFSELYGRASQDEIVRAVCAGSAKILGVGISNLSKLVAPELIILSGPLITRINSFYEDCVKSFRELNKSDNGPIFVREGTFGENVIAVGAGLMPMEHYFRKQDKMSAECL